MKSLLNPYIGILLLFALNLGQLSAFGPGQETNPNNTVPEVFTHTTVGKAMRASKHGKKLVFAFVYTDWSIPSKRMLDSTFQNPKVIHELSADYETVAVNGSRKKRFIQDYNVHAFPTLFIMDFQGEVIIRSKGYKDAADLLTTISKTRSNSRFLKQTLDTLSFTANRTNILAMIDSVEYYRDDYEAKNLAKMYLDKKSTDWRDPESMYLIKEYFYLDKKYLKFISKYHFKFFEVFDSIPIKENLAFNIFINSLDTDKKGRAKFNYKPVRKWFRKHRIHGADKLENFVKIKYLLWGRGPSITYSVRLLRDYPETTDENVLFASVIRLLISDGRRRIDFDDIIFSVKRSIKEDGTFLRYDILSLLYYKNGQDAKAREMIDVAKGIAINTKQEYSPTLDMISDLIIR